MKKISKLILRCTVWTKSAKIMKINFWKSDFWKMKFLIFEKGNFPYKGIFLKRKISFYSKIYVTQHTNKEICVTFIPFLDVCVTKICTIKGKFPLKEISKIEIFNFSIFEFSIFQFSNFDFSNIEISKFEHLISL